jgi:hypothetical protein
MTPAELLLYSFDALQAWAGEQNMARRSDQTPFEFAEILQENAPAVSHGVRPVVRMYVDRGETAVVQALLDRGESAWLASVRAYDRSGDWIAEGFVTPGSGIREKCRIQPGAANATVHLARKLDTLPETAAAFAAGARNLFHSALSAPYKGHRSRVFAYGLLLKR